MDELILRLEDFVFAYPDGPPVLEGVDLALAPGERLALLGPNGAGKSSLLLCLAGFLRGTGTLELFGRSMDRKNVRALRRELGLVFDDPDDQLFMPTVGEDVAFGPLNLGLEGDEVRRRVDEALAATGLEGFSDRLASHLSRGQKRRAALATVLAMRPRLLLLDEPTAFLDPRGKADLARVLENLPSAQITATHDLAFVRPLCTAAAVLVDGRIRARGPIDEILADEGLLEEAGLLG